MKKIILFVAALLAALPFTLASSIVNAEEVTEEPTNEETVIEDTESPVIIGENSYNATTKSQLSIDTLTNTLTVIDDSEVELTVSSDTYSSSWNKPGEYHVVYKATDAASNSAFFTIKIVVTDGVAPVFYDKNGEIKSSMVVIKSSNTLLTKDELMKKVICLDDIDGEIIDFEVISDSYTGFGDKSGTYSIKFSASDKAKNSAEFEITIAVVTNLEDIIIYDYTKVVTPANRKLSKTDFANILKTCGYYTESTTTYIDVDCEAYESSSELPGTYLVECSLKSTAGTEKTITLTVEVIEEQNSDIKSDETNGVLRIIKKIWDFFVNLFSKFFDWLTGLFD